jgi:branched-chain amino acid transport system substrate-binding protein
MKSRRYARAAAALIGMSLVATACSSSGSKQPAASGGSSAGSSASTPTGTPIPVGVVGTYSGPLASSIAGAKAAIEAWASSVNASGGINGHPVKLFLKDDAGNVAQALTAVKELVESDHVVAIVGQASGSASSWASYVTGKGIPVVGGSTNDATYQSQPDFYSIGGNLVDTYYGLSALAKTNGPKVGDLYCAEIPACAATVPLLQGFGQYTGVSLSYSAKVAASTADFTAVCQGLKSAGVQSYSLGLAAATLMQVQTACRQQGLKAILILAGNSDSTMAADPIFDGVQITDGTFPFFDTSIPASKKFHDVIAKYAPTLGSAQLPLNSESTQAYVSGIMFEAAVKASGESEVTADSVKKGLYAFKDETLGGLAVPLNFIPGKASPHNCYFSFAIDGGKFVEPNGITPKCIPDETINAVVATLGK